MFLAFALEAVEEEQQVQQVQQVEHKQVQRRKQVRHFRVAVVSCSSFAGSFAGSAGPRASSLQTLASFGLYQLMLTF